MSGFPVLQALSDTLAREDSSDEGKLADGGAALWQLEEDSSSGSESRRSSSVSEGDGCRMVVLHQRSDWDCDTHVHNKPRIISEVKKDRSPVVSKPLICGHLLWTTEVNHDAHWQERFVEVRDGTLLILEGGRAVFRLVLRYLNLQSVDQETGRNHTFCLSREDEPRAVLQAPTQQDYERWIKVLVVELLKQTPLDGVKYLDIMKITETMKKPSTWEDDGEPKDQTRLTHLLGYPVSRSPVASLTNSSDSCNDEEEDDEVGKLPEDEEELRSRCQSDVFVPVKEKRRLFEVIISKLSREAEQSTRKTPPRRNIGRSCVSTENLNTLMSKQTTHRFQERNNLANNRTKSLHDLSETTVVERTSRCVSIKDMCRMFEEKSSQGCAPSVRTRGAERGGRSGWGVNGSSPKEVVPCWRGPYRKQEETVLVNISNAYLSRRKLLLKEQRLERLRKEAEEKQRRVWSIQEQLEDLEDSRQSNGEGFSEEEFQILEKQLQAEEKQLSKLQEERLKVLRDIEQAMMKFETALARHEGDCSTKL